MTRPDPATVYLATKLAYNPSKEHLINSLILNLEDRQSEVKQIAKMALKTLSSGKIPRKKIPQQLFDLAETQRKMNPGKTKSRENKQNRLDAALMALLVVQAYLLGLILEHNIYQKV